MLVYNFLSSILCGVLSFGRSASLVRPRKVVLIYASLRTICFAVLAGINACSRAAFTPQNTLSSVLRAAVSLHLLLFCNR